MVNLGKYPSSSSFYVLGIDSNELCSGQEDRKCATRCMNRFHTGETNAMEKQDADYWTSWVQQRMKTVREASSKVDLFIAPSEHLQKRFIEEFHLPAHKVKYVLASIEKCVYLYVIRYIDYGFDISRLYKPQMQPRNEYVFGCICVY